MKMGTRIVLAVWAAVLWFAPIAVRAQPASVSAGEYLTRAADCEACHTAPGGTPFAGGRAFSLPFGVIYSPNLTPDPKTGIAGYSDDDWVRALREGIGRGGKHLYPAMPYASYTAMTRDDALAIKAYLLSLAPVAASPPANTLRFPFNQRWGLFFWNLLNNSNRRFTADQGKSAAYNRGDYLVNALGHCGECHTPRTATLGLKNDQRFAGAVQGGWLAYNLTSDREHGIGGWSDAALTTYLATGQADGHGPASGPMGEVISDSLRHLTPDDVQAMVIYLRGVAALPVGPQRVDASGDAPADALGARIFAQACAGCHLPNGDGRQSPWAALRGDHSVGDPAGTNLVQVLTHGSQIETGMGTMFMHPFTGAYSDAELAALARYTTSQFGFRASRVTAPEIGKQREP